MMGMDASCALQPSLWHECVHCLPSPLALLELLLLLLLLLLLFPDHPRGIVISTLPRQANRPILLGHGTFFLPDLQIRQPLWLSNCCRDVQLLDKERQSPTAVPGSTSHVFNGADSMYARRRGSGVSWRARVLQSLGVPARMGAHGGSSRWDGERLPELGAAGPA